MDGIRLRSPLGQVLRVGHKGAAALAPANTLEALAVALDHAVDMVEFDVVSREGGELVLAHSADEVTSSSPALDDALELLAARAPSHVGIDLDLKLPGYEDRAIGTVRAHNLLHRTLVCSLFPGSLRAVRRSTPGAITGLSYPFDRHGIGERRWARPAVHVGVVALRVALPSRIVRLVRFARADAAVLHYTVISPAVVDRCHENDIPVLAWTVDTRAHLRAVVAAGVDGVIANDPLLFDSISDGS